MCTRPSPQQGEWPGGEASGTIRARIIHELFGTCADSMSQATKRGRSVWPGDEARLYLDGN